MASGERHPACAVRGGVQFHDTSVHAGVREFTGSNVWFLTDLFNLMAFLMVWVSRRFEKSSLINELRSRLIIEWE